MPAEFSLLENSGLTLYWDESRNIMAFEAPLLYARYGRKLAGEMKGLLRDPAAIDLGAPFYDVYRNIHYAEDEAVLAKDKYCYDITAVMPGQINGECKKTSGHYHAFNADRTYCHPEIYEVVKGTAIYILQRAKNFENNPAELEIEDLIIARVEAGQTIIIPPNYGHCSINGGDGAMLFSNLAYAASYNHYKPVEHYVGMAYYVMRENGHLRFVKNPHYANLPEPKFTVVRENPRLGILFGKSLYHGYREHPELFRYLGNPDGFEKEILGMLEPVASLS